MFQVPWRWALCCAILMSCAGAARADWATDPVPGTLPTLATLEAPSMTVQAAAPDFTTELPDVGLWKYVATVRAMQFEMPLEQLQGQLRILEATSPPPAAVPLPGAAWFLLTGLLGLVGVKLGGAARRPRPTRMAPDVICVSH